MKQQTFDKWQTLVIVEAVAKFVKQEKDKILIEDKVSNRYTEDLDNLLHSLEKATKITVKY